MSLGRLRRELLDFGVGEGTAIRLGRAEAGCGVAEARCGARDIDWRERLLLSEAGA
jgi:hypothetical protein